MGRLNLTSRTRSDGNTLLRRKAYDKGQRFFSSGKHCIHGHVSKRYVKSGECVECTKISQTKSQKKNKTTPIRVAAATFCIVPDVEQTPDQKDYAKYKKRVRAYQKKYYKKYFKANREKHKKYMQDYHARRKAIAAAIKDNDRPTICKIIESSKSNKSFHSRHLKEC